VKVALATAGGASGRQEHACELVLAEQRLLIHGPAHIRVQHRQGHLNNASISLGCCLALSMQSEPLALFCPLPARTMHLVFCTQIMVKKGSHYIQNILMLAG